MKTFIVIAADIITKQGIEPFVGLNVSVNGKTEQIARTCKQALLDLHKSARASNIPSGLYDNGVDNANPIMHNLFREAIIGLINKTGYADVNFYEAGAEYIATAESSAVARGDAKVGDILFTEKKGSRIEGFVTFPLTDAEQARRDYLANGDQAFIMKMLFGLGNPVAAVAPEVTPATPTMESENAGSINEPAFNTMPEDVVEPTKPAKLVK